MENRRLRGMRTYLAGAMDRVYDGGIGWRNVITPLLNSKGVIVLDPCNKPYLGLPESPDARKMLNDWRKAGEYGKVRDYMREVRIMDLRMVDVSDFIILSIDMTVHMCGSYEELTLANRQKKPILCWIQQGKSEAPNWLFGMVPHEHIFGSLDEVISYLAYIDESSHVNTLKRWCFPDFDMLYDSDILGSLPLGV